MDTTEIKLHGVARADRGSGQLRAQIALPDQDEDLCSAGMNNGNLDDMPSHSIIVFAKSADALEKIGHALVAAAVRARREDL